MPAHGGDDGFRDPRRLGFVAHGAVAAYGVCLFSTGSAIFRLVFALIATVVFALVALLVPIGQWQESEKRKRLAGKLMVIEALAIGAVLTVIRLMTW